MPATRRPRSNESGDAKPHAPDPGSEARGHSSLKHTLAIALVTGAFGLLGVVAGGVATYLGSRDLQRSQQSASTRGVARVLQLQLFRAFEQWHNYRKGGRHLPADFGVRMPQPDLQRVAGGVDADTWRAVAIAIGGIHFITDRKSRRGCVDRGTVDDLEFERNMIDGFKALNEITGVTMGGPSTTPTRAVTKCLEQEMGG